MTPTTQSHSDPAEISPTAGTGSSPDREMVSALSPRGLLVGLLCVILTCLVVCFAELVVGKIQIGFLQLPPVVVGMLVLILGVQAVFSRLSTRWRLKPHELFTVHVMMLMASMVSSRGLLEKLIPLLVVPNYDATDANNWRGLFFQHIPSWAVPFDPNGSPKQFSSARFFEALRPGERIPWQMWTLPLLFWFVFVALMLTAFLCMAAILRRQWVDNEKLSFPLVQLPLEMIRAGDPTTSRGTETSFLQNRLTWTGFAIPAVVFGFNGLHQWYPSVPEITTQIDINSFFVAPPWNQMLYFQAFLSFAAIGFFYLLPTDLLFSLCLFFLMTRGMDVVSASLGYQPEVMPMYGCRLYYGYQIIGCYFVLAGYMLYAARPHLARVFHLAVSLNRRTGPLLPEDRDELLPYRFAFWGLIFSLLLCAGWMWQFGMSFPLALFLLSISLFLVVMVMARSACESGMLMTETSFRPVDVYRMVGDVRSLGAANITGMAFLDALWFRDQRGLMLTGFLDAARFSDGVRVRRRSLIGVFILSILLAMLVSGYLHIALPYRLGAVSMYSYVYRGNPVWAFNDAATVLNGSRPPLPWFAPLNFAIGLCATMGMVILRSRLMWFPLHPLGYALSSTWTMMVFWFPCLIAWLIKSLILRYGGMRLFAKARPFFLGMVLGEFTMAVLWTIPSIFYRTPTPAFPWP